MNPELAAAGAGVCASAVVLVVAEQVAGRLAPPSRASKINVWRFGAAALALLVMALFGPVAGAVTALLAWQGLVLLPKLRVRSKLRRIDAAFPEFAAGVASGLAAGLKPVDALSLVAEHRNDALGTSVRSACRRIDAGQPWSVGLKDIKREFPCAGIAALVAILESGAVRGTDVVESITSLVLSSRSSQLAARRDRAAKAGPLIQLVVALGLVPSVLLLIAAVAIARGFSSG